ncbi:MAG: hypothetical protein JWM74_2830, partial [Myxococcaceae bacterium]|nr:hypothetical protein [Myxococcaceae bacterium]
RGAAVVLVHGTDADRSDMLAEMRALGRAGYGALAYDAPGHGESDGVVTFGSCEVKTVVAAAEHVAQLPGVDAARVGAVGASAGGAIVGVASAETSRLRAVALVAAFTDSEEQTRFVYRGKGPLSQEPALRVDREHMIDGPLRAIDAVRKTKVRAVFIVQGTDDPIVPPYMATQLHEAVAVAAPPINELWMIEHGRHLHLEEVTNGAYGKRLVEFFDRGLAR